MNHKNLHKLQYANIQLVPRDLKIFLVLRSNNRIPYFIIS